MSELFESLLSVISSRVAEHHATHGHQHYHGHTGYWGRPSATVDWCEPNYQYTDYIAEFFNTVSSFAMVICGLVGAAIHYRHLERRFLLVFMSVALVGIGSAAFHGTLLFSLQMLDELPMIYTSLLLAYCVVQNDHVKERYYPALPLGLLVHGVLTTLLVASPALAPQYASPLLQFICFHVSFGLLEIFLFTKTTQFWLRETNPQMQRIHVAGVCLWTLGIIFWVLDYAGCETLFEGDLSLRRLFLSWQLDLTDYPLTSLSDSRVLDLSVPNPQLHAWWHVCASTGLYLMTIVVAHRRCLVLGKTADIRVFMGVPYVHVSSSTLARSRSRSTRKSKAERTSTATSPTRAAADTVIAQLPQSKSAAAPRKGRPAARSRSSRSSGEDAALDSAPATPSNRRKGHKMR